MMSNYEKKNSILLEINNVSVFYGAIQVLFDISLKVPDGQIVALLGRNAAGKTTTMSAITGLIRPRKGSIVYDGEDISQKDTSEIVRRGIMMVPEGRRIFPEMTVFENLEIGAFLKMKGKSFAESLEYVYALFPRLAERRKQIGGTLSGGEQQMLSIGRALMGKPRLLLLDEPSMGLAPVLIEQVFEAIKQINSTGTTIFLIEQNVSLALEVSQYGYVLEKGSIVMHGKASDLVSNQKVQKAYLDV
jgi:branched-chain amino acid transport system ATP-binding protein